jgi:protein TonB
VFEASLDGAVEGSRTPWTFTLSLLAQSLVLCIVLLAALLSRPLPPNGSWSTILLEPPPPAAQPPEIPAPLVRTRANRFDDRLTQPRDIPDQVAVIVDEAIPWETVATAPDVGVPGGIPGGIGVLGILAGPPGVRPPPPPPPAVAAAPTIPEQIRVSESIQKARLIHRVEPRYPSLAKQARVQGLVRLRAIIAKDGSIQSLEVISGHPLLIPEAVAAVRQWRYRPTLLNGVEVEVVTQVDVHFRLN